MSVLPVSSVQATIGIDFLSKTMYLDDRTVMCLACGGEVRVYVCVFTHVCRVCVFTHVCSVCVCCHALGS